MPLYPFVCTKCNKENEFLLTISEIKDMDIHKEIQLEQKCSKCGSSSFKRIIAAHGRSPFNWHRWCP